ncbi:hypothetical protein LMH87_004970 [Akanthomyces muscarius]|uniref:COPII vesicles protein Yip3 n=1 Tax=Akanthomyces muscarius TaxID=2231603 RepID=A0A9W8QKU8_AKAMU|nr:hypothetical protein LMH87_004970 [Akanthomyces muscarius]KAJ4163228.1 hypothetical protein LMH87_004970 [Akanthomyces muscarius]
MFGSRVEEVNSDDDESDGHGVGLSARRQTRFVSDSLQFTGTDLGDRSAGVVRRGPRYQDSDDDSEQTSDNSESEDEDETEGSYSGSSQQSLSAKEEALVQSALKRINRAQAQGRTDVKLNKEELAALERRRKRMQEEAERAERERAARASGSSGSDRKKKRKEQRVAVPLSQFEPVSRKKRSGSNHPPRKDSLPARSSVGDSSDHQVYPPMGYFPPPSGSRSRSSSHLQRPGSSRARDTNGNSPPVSFQQHASSSSHRHASDSVTRPRSRGMPHEEAWNANTSLDPFQYQTDGPRAAYPSSSKGSRSEVAYKQSSRGHGTSSPVTRSRHGSARPSLSRVPDSETSEEDTASDELGNGAQIREQQHSSVRGRRSREIVVEVEPEPALPPPPPAKKKSSSPTKRKPAPNGKKKKR